MQLEIKDERMYKLELTPKKDKLFEILTFE